MRPLAILLLLSATASAATHRVSIQTSSPVGIEQTLMAIGTGAVRDSGGGNAYRIVEADLREMGQKITTIPLTVRINGQVRDVRIITHLTRLSEQLPALRDNPTRAGVSSALSTGIKAIEAGRAIIEAERLVRSFIRDDGQIPGSFAYRYSCVFQGKRVTRQTYVEDGHLRLTTTLYDVPRADCATLVIDAREVETGSTVNSTLIVQTRFGRLRIVAALIRRTMCTQLREIESRAIALGRRGESSLIGAAKVFVELVGKRGI